MEPESFHVANLISLHQVSGVPKNPPAGALSVRIKELRERNALLDAPGLRKSVQVWCLTMQKYWKNGGKMVGTC